MPRTFRISFYFLPLSLPPSFLSSPFWVHSLTIVITSPSSTSATCLCARGAGTRPDTEVPGSSSLTNIPNSARPRMERGTSVNPLERLNRRPDGTSGWCCRISDVIRWLPGRCTWEASIFFFFFFPFPFLFFYCRATTPARRKRGRHR